MKLYNFFYEEKTPGILQIKGFFPIEFLGLQTNRQGGDSAPPFDSFNLGTHVGDSDESVAKNRARLAGCLPGEPAWLQQVHGCEVALVPTNANQLIADACVTARIDQICAVMTADCLPLLVARPATGQCAAIHAGWRGLAAGVIEKTLQRMLAEGPRASGEDIWYIWLGPAIGQDAFEVGPEVREKFVLQHPMAAAAFLLSVKTPGHFMASLQQLALLRLKTFESFNPSLEIRVAIDQDCVFQSTQRYFSFRREAITGRMASLIFRRIGSEA